MPQDIIDIDNILERLITLCEAYNLKLPCDLDSWHGFDSTNTKSLIKLGLYLETIGWRFIGMWPNPTGARNFQLRVARTGVYDTHALVAEIKKMRELVTDYTLVHYSDCTQQPIA